MNNKINKIKPLFNPISVNIALTARDVTFGMNVIMPNCFSV